MRVARVTASVRLEAPSFVSNELTWKLDGVIADASSRAIALFGKPDATSASTSRSRGLKKPSLIEDGAPVGLPVPPTRLGMDNIPDLRRIVHEQPDCRRPNRSNQRLALRIRE